MIALPSVTHFAAACKGGGFLGFPHWYQYLDSKVDSNGLCTPRLGSLSDIWLIIAAIIEILLRVAAIISVAMIIYSGISYILSQGVADKTAKAKGALINALVGLAISVSAAMIVSFIAGSFN